MLGGSVKDVLFITLSSFPLPDLFILPSFHVREKRSIWKLELSLTVKLSNGKSEQRVKWTNAEKRRHIELIPYRCKSPLNPLVTNSCPFLHVILIFFLNSNLISQILKPSCCTTGAVTRITCWIVPRDQLKIPLHSVLISGRHCITGGGRQGC